MTSTPKLIQYGFLVVSIVGFFILFGASLLCPPILCQTQWNLGYTSSPLRTLLLPQRTMGELSLLFDLNDITTHQFAFVQSLAAGCIKNINMKRQVHRAVNQFNYQSFDSRGTKVSSAVTPIIVVYFTHFVGNYSFYIFERQLTDLYLSGLPARAQNVYVILSSSKASYITQARTLAASFVQKTHVNIEVLEVTKNMFEYPGVHLTWLIGCYVPDALVLYFHAKGVTHEPYNGPTTRFRQESTLFYEIVSSWRDVIQLFELMPELGTVGFSPSPEHFQWFNFWWARGSYLSSRVEPIITNTRHYYEYWLSRTSWTMLCPPRTHAQNLTQFFYRLIDKSYHDHSEATERYYISSDGSAFGLARCSVQPLSAEDVINKLDARTWELRR